MVVVKSTHSFCFSIVTAFTFMLLLLSACGGTGNATSSSSTQPSFPPPTSGTGASTAATATSITKFASFIGQPKVKMLSGTSFETDGRIKNNDTYQHDFTLKVTLLDASGKVIATTTQLVDNVKGGTTVSYAIQGTTTQPDWSTVEVAVIKVSENINGSGDD